MPLVVTTNATIQCVHGGRVILTPKQATVQAGGGMVVRETDLIGAPIVGCALVPSPSTKPCTAVVSVIPGTGSATRVTAGGLPLHTQTLSGITDAVPPGTIMVVNPGQTSVSAM